MLSDRMAVTSNVLLEATAQTTKMHTSHASRVLPRARSLSLPFPFPLPLPLPSADWLHILPDGNSSMALPVEPSPTATDLLNSSMASIKSADGPAVGEGLYAMVVPRSIRLAAPNEKEEAMAKWQRRQTLPPEKLEWLYGKTIPGSAPGLPKRSYSKVGYRFTAPHRC
jgi:hypothetical protein